MHRGGGSPAKVRDTRKPNLRFAPYPPPANQQGANVHRGGVSKHAAVKSGAERGRTDDGRTQRRSEKGDTHEGRGGGGGGGCKTPFPTYFPNPRFVFRFSQKTALYFSIFCAIFCPKYENLFFHICGCISEYLVLAIEVGRLGHHKVSGRPWNVHGFLCFFEGEQGHEMWGLHFIAVGNPYSPPPPEV